MIGRKEQFYYHLRIHSFIHSFIHLSIFYLKSFLNKSKHVKFSIPERVYVDLGEKKFKEIFSDQILEFEDCERNLIELEVVKTYELNLQKKFETFKISIT